MKKYVKITNRQGEHFLSPYYDKYIDNSTYSCYTFIDIYFKINLNTEKTSGVFSTSRLLILYSFFKNNVENLLFLCYTVRAESIKLLKNSVRKGEADEKQYPKEIFCGV